MLPGVEYFVYSQRMCVNKSRDQTLVTLRKGKSDRKKCATPGVMAAAALGIWCAGSSLVVCKEGEQTYLGVGKSHMQKGSKPRADHGG